MTSRARSLGSIERSIQGLGGAVALVALTSALVGVARGLRRSVGLESGRPGVVIAAFPISVLSVAFLGVSAIMWRRLPVTLGVPGRFVATAIGGTAMMSGLGLYLAAMASLWPDYNVASTFGARLYRDQRLVTWGPYAIVRHPMYVGLAIAAVGAFLLYRTWTTLAYLALLPVFAIRSRREEEVLADQFGAAWVAYRDRVPPWLPGSAPHR